MSRHARTLSQTSTTRLLQVWYLEKKFGAMVSGMSELTREPPASPVKLRPSGI
jgi:hypothetical protein